MSRNNIAGRERLVRERLRKEARAEKDARKIERRQAKRLERGADPERTGGPLS